MAQTIIRYVIFDSQGRLLPESQIYKARYWNIEFETPKAFRYASDYEFEFPSKLSAAQKRLILEEEVASIIYQYQKRLEKRRAAYSKRPEVILRRKKLREKMAKLQQEKEKEKKEKELRKIQRELLKKYPKKKEIRFGDLGMTLVDYYTATVGFVKSEQFIFRKIEIWFDEVESPVLTRSLSEEEIERFEEYIYEGFKILAERAFSTGTAGTRRFITKLITPHYDKAGKSQYDDEKDSYTFGFSTARDDDPSSEQDIVKFKVPNLIKEFFTKAIKDSDSYISKDFMSMIELKAVQLEELVYEPREVIVKRNVRQNPYMAPNPKMKKFAKKAKKKRVNKDISLWDLLRSNLKKQQK